VTAEQRVAIEVTDIAAFELQCPECQSRISVPIAKFDHLDQKCPNCRMVWFTALGGADHKFVYDMLEMLKNFQRPESQPKPKVRFQLKECSLGPKREAQ